MPAGIVARKFRIVLLRLLRRGLHNRPRRFFTGSARSAVENTSTAGRAARSGLPIALLTVRRLLLGGGLLLLLLHRLRLFEDGELVLLDMAVEGRDEGARLGVVHHRPLEHNHVFVGLRKL